MTKLYQILTSRNAGYVSAGTQALLSKTRVLIAGCGIGSQVAEAAVRIGFQNFVLTDGDVVDPHNLNRQFFFADQVGQPKASALKDNILRINPEAQVEARVEMLGTKNVRDLVERVDLVFDTIDFLDLQAIVALHDEAHRQLKTVVSSFAVGFGAAVISLPPDTRGHAWIRDIFSLPSEGDVTSISYVERFQKLFHAIATGLDPVVLQVMQKVFQDIADGKTCPAPQVAPGAHAVAAACVTAAVRLLAGEPVSLGPQMVVVNLVEDLQKKGFLLA